MNDNLYYEAARARMEAKVRSLEAKPASGALRWQALALVVMIVSFVALVGWFGTAEGSAWLDWIVSR